MEDILGPDEYISDTDIEEFLASPEMVQRGSYFDTITLPFLKFAFHHQTRRCGKLLTQTQEWASSFVNSAPLNSRLSRIFLHPSAITSFNDIKLSDLL